MATKNFAQHTGDERRVAALLSSPSGYRLAGHATILLPVGIDRRFAAYRSQRCTPCPYTHAGREGRLDAVRVVGQYRVANGRRSRCAARAHRHLTTNASAWVYLPPQQFWFSLLRPRWRGKDHKQSI